jgi:hypothetical protein
MIFAVVACWHDTAYAHDGVVLTVHSDGRGSVWADATWADGHPVGEPLVAAISGQSDAGQALGPAPLAAGTPAARYEGTLEPGRWTVTVDAAAPGAGTCTAEFLVGPEATEQSATCGAPALPATTAHDAPAGDGSDRRVLLGIVGLALAAAVGVGALVARRRVAAR